jgi:hypothetical protein
LCELSAIASALRGLRRRNRCGACARATATAFRLSERPRHRERRWLDDPKAGRVGLVDPAFGLQRASLSIPEAIGEEKRLHPRDRERVEAKFPPSDQLLAPSFRQRKISPWQTARRRAAPRDKPSLGLKKQKIGPQRQNVGGESQQWLSYPTNLHVRFDERGVETELRLSH